MRLEYKFLVRNENLDRLRRKILPFVKLDSFIEEQSDNEYTVRSIYFDSPHYDFYHEKIEGIKIRKKLRIRSYDEQTSESVVFLEIKNKFDDFIGKNRSVLEYDNLNSLLQTKSVESYALTHNGYKNSIKDGEKFFHHVIRDDLKPTILIVYDREAFFSKFDDSLRITFDKNIRYFNHPAISNLYKDNDLEFAIPNHFVLELKFNNGYPRWLRDIVQEFGLIRRSVSKYTICIDSSNKINPMKKALNISDNSFLYNSPAEEGIF